MLINSICFSFTMLEKLVGNLFKPKGVDGPQIVEAVWKYISKQQKYVEVDIRIESELSWSGEKDKKELYGVSCIISDDSDYHRSKSGEMTYDSVRIFTFGKKKWAISKGYKTGNYPGDEYESDIMAVEIESQDKEKIRKTIGEKCCWFDKSLIVSNSWNRGHEINFFGKGDFYKFFKKRINNLKDLETKLGEHSSGWGTDFHYRVKSYRAKDIKKGDYHPQIIKKIGDAILYGLTAVSKTTAERWQEKFEAERTNDLRRVVQMCSKNKEISETAAEQLNNLFIYLHSYAVEPSVPNNLLLKNYIKWLSSKEYPTEAVKYLPDYTKLISRLDNRLKKALINKVSSFKSIDSYLVQNEVTPRKLEENKEWWNFPVSHRIVTTEHLAEAFNLDVKTVEEKLKKYNVDVLK